MMSVAGVDLKLYQRGLKLMGNHFEFSAVAGDERVGMDSINLAITEVRRIEKLLTTYDDSSVTNQLNAAAGINAVSVDQEVYDLIERSIRISKLTDGAFDITYGSIDKRFWNFDTQMTSLPDPKAAKAAVKLINYEHVILNESDRTVFLKSAGMRIGFGGIGKGYAADRAKKVMLESGIKNGIVNAAGDLTVWGAQPNGESWTVGIADPDLKQMPFGSLKLNNASVATSGNYEKYVTIGGKKYSHTIDPRTGYPVEGIKSVTIICSIAELADALTTPVMVKGVKAGLNMIDQIKGVACIVIDENNRMYTSRNINIL